MSECLGSVLEGMPMGVVVLDRNARVQYQNSAARDLITRAGGISIRKGVLIPCSLAAGEWFRRSVMEVVDGRTPQRRVFVFRSDDDYSRVLHGLLVRLGTTDCCALYLSDPAAADQLDTSVVQQLWRLTPAEARVAAAIVDLETAEEVGEQLGVSSHTVRSHLKQIFEKTGVGRRSVLVRILCRGVASLRAQEETESIRGPLS